MFARRERYGRDDGRDMGGIKGGIKGGMKRQLSFV